MTSKEFEKTAANDLGCCICSTPIEPVDDFTWYGDQLGNAFCAVCSDQG